MGGRRGLTFSGKGIGFIACFFSGSADSLCLMRFDGVGDDGSSSALRFAPVYSQNRGYQRVFGGRNGLWGSSDHVPSSFTLDDIASDGAARATMGESVAAAGDIATSCWPSSSRLRHGAEGSPLICADIIT